ncbi:MAG: hypothetical protein H7Y28_06360 [Rhodoferax sp.]|nr:hypothetical protein [Rhodoferax sp.]
MDNSSRDKNSISGSVGMVDGRIQEVATSAHGAVDHAANIGHHAIDATVAVAKPADVWISEKSSALMATQRNAVASTRQYIVEHPLQSIGIALAAGLLLGRLKGASGR